MSKVILLPKSDNTVSIIYPVGMTADNLVLLPEFKTGVIFKKTDLPNDVDFCDAWTLSGNKKSVYVDIMKARELTKKRLREERKPLLKQLDVDFQLALELGLDKTDIIQEKQRLRDITNLVDKINTFAELRNLRC